MQRVLSLLTIFIISASFSANAQHKDSAAVVAAVNKFLTAFNNFNWTNFRESFTDDATMFHPFWMQSRRIKGRDEIDRAWLNIFPEFTDTANTKKLNITPRDVNIQFYDKTAIVTFHLGDGVRSIGRRTLVMVGRKGVWKIVHLHASVLKKEDP